MTAIDKLFDHYDCGHLSRRELLSALALVGFTSATINAQTQAAAVTSTTLNHLQLRVKDLEQSLDFYSRLLDAKKTREPNPQTTWGLVMAGASVVLLKSADRQGIDHFGVGIERFDPERIHTAIKRNLPNSDAYITADRTAVSVHDPNGILVQIAQK
jgi:glyoxalase/bleomycin resistance protein/dioxygenase superfamily protein